MGRNAVMSEGAHTKKGVENVCCKYLGERGDDVINEAGGGRDERY